MKIRTLTFEDATILDMNRIRIPGDPPVSIWCEYENKSSPLFGAGIALDGVLTYNDLPTLHMWYNPYQGSARRAEFIARSLRGVVGDAFAIEAIMKAPRWHTDKWSEAIVLVGDMAPAPGIFWLAVHTGAGALTLLEGNMIDGKSAHKQIATLPGDGLPASRWFRAAWSVVRSTDPAVGRVVFMIDDDVVFDEHTVTTKAPDGDHKSEIVKLYQHPDSRQERVVNLAQVTLYDDPADVEPKKGCTPAALARLFTST